MPDLVKITYEGQGRFNPARGGNGGHSAEDIIEHYKELDFAVQVIGFVIHEDEECFIIGQSYEENRDFYMNSWRLLKRTILSMVVLEKGEKDATV